MFLSANWRVTFRFKGKRAEIVGVMVANVVGLHLLRVANDAHRVGA